MIPTLTVRETVLFSARMRLPSIMNDAEREERTDVVIRQMGLSHVMNTKGCCCCCCCCCFFFFLVTDYSYALFQLAPRMKREFQVVKGNVWQSQLSSLQIRLFSFWMNAPAVCKYFFFLQHLIHFLTAQNEYRGLSVFCLFFFFFLLISFKKIRQMLFVWFVRFII